MINPEQGSYSWPLLEMGTSSLCAEVGQLRYTQISSEWLFYTQHSDDPHTPTPTHPHTDEDVQCSSHIHVHVPLNSTHALSPSTHTCTCTVHHMLTAKWECWLVPILETCTSPHTCTCTWPGQEAIRAHMSVEVYTCTKMYHKHSYVVKWNSRVTVYVVTMYHALWTD